MNPDAVPLPCPMCNATLSGASASGYHYHPANGCIFSGFEVSRDDVAAWNRRHPDVPTADDGEIWPSATVIVDEQGNVISAKLYAPGLPAGRHDLFPVRVPYMDEHTEAWLAVSNTLKAVDPDYLNGHGNAIEQAVAAIRKLASLVTPAAQAADLSNEDASLIERLQLLASGDGVLIKSEFANTTISCAIQRLAASRPSNPATQADHIADERKMVALEQVEAVRVDWISVTERLPDDDAVILVSAWQYGKPGGERFTMIARRSGSVFLNEESGDDLYTPTHWMPLPAAPASSSGDQV